MSQRLQKAVDKVEVWVNNWRFRLSVAKTQVICITKGKRVPSVKLKLYKQELEQVSEVKYLCVWMQSRLTFAMHVKKLKSKCFTMSIWCGIRGANMGYTVYAVHRSATRMGGIVPKTSLRKLSLIKLF